MIKRINIPLKETEYEILFDFSQKELRNPTEQAHYFIRKCLVEINQIEKEKKGEFIETEPTI